MHELLSLRLFWESATSPTRMQVRCTQSAAPCSSKSCYRHHLSQMGIKTSQKIVVAAHVNGAAVVRAESDKPPNGQSWAGISWVLCICWRIIDTVFCGRSMFSCMPRELLCFPSRDSTQLMDKPWAWLRNHKWKWEFQSEMLFGLTLCILFWFWPFEFLLVAVFHTPLPHAVSADHPAERLWADASLLTFNRVLALFALLSSTVSPPLSLIALVTHPTWSPWKPYFSELVCIYM